MSHSHNHRLCHDTDRELLAPYFRRYVSVCDFAIWQSINLENTVKRFV